MDKQQKLRLFVVFVLGVALLANLVGCKREGYSTDAKHLTVLTGSENKPLEPLMKRWAQGKGYEIEIRYLGSIQIMQTLQKGKPDFDAVWPSQSIYLNLGDQLHQVRDRASIYTTTLCMGIREGIVEKMKLVGNELSTKKLIELVNQGYSFAMTNPTNSNSALMGYLGILYYLADNPRILEKVHLQDPNVAAKMKAIMGAVNMRAETNGDLVDRFTGSEAAGIMTYEATLLQFNQRLVKEGREPLRIFYLTDCPPAVDAPLGFVSHGHDGKEGTFMELQKFLQSPEIQNELAKLGYRTGVGGVPTEGTDTSLFKAEWGANIAQQPKNVTLPELDTLLAAMNAYRVSFGKPPCTEACVDFSGSMKEKDKRSDKTGEEQAQEAMKLLLDPTLARENGFELSPRGILVLKLFEGYIRKNGRFYIEGADPNQLKDVLAQVQRHKADGGTDIYGTAIEAIKELSQRSDLANFVPCIVIMTDGDNRSSVSIDDLFKAWDEANENWKKQGVNVPIYVIGFGDANDTILRQIATHTNGKYFDGHEDLVGAFKHVWGSQ